MKDDDLPLHGNTGNKHAAKPKREKLTAQRSFRFKEEEIRGYNRSKGKNEPLRMWVRRILNQEAGLPPPEIEDK